LSFGNTLKRVIKAEGVRAPEFLRRAFSNVGSEPNKILSQLDELATKYNIPAGQGIFDKASMSIAAENAAQLPPPPNSLKGIILDAGKTVVAPKMSLLDKLFSVKPQNTTDIFSRLVDANIKPADISSPFQSSFDYLPGALQGMGQKVFSQIGSSGIGMAGKSMLGAAPSEILDKLQSVGLKTKNQSMISEPQASKPFSFMDMLIPEANASPELPSLPAAQKLPTAAQKSEYTPLKTLGESFVPGISSQISGLGEMAKRLGQLTPEQLSASTTPPKQTVEQKHPILGRIPIIKDTLVGDAENKLLSRTNTINQQLAQIDNEMKGVKKPAPGKTIAQIYNESDTKKAIATATDIFKKSFNLK
jgi:hypothetical protein